MNWLRLSWNGFFWQDWKINVTESQSCTKFLLFQNLKSLSAKGTYQSKEYRRVKRKEQEKYYDKLARASEEKEAFLKQDFITWEESWCFLNLLCDVNICPNFGDIFLEEIGITVKKAQTGNNPPPCSAIQIRSDAAGQISLSAEKAL